MMVRSQINQRRKKTSDWGLLCLDKRYSRDPGLCILSRDTTAISVRFRLFATGSLFVWGVMSGFPGWVASTDQ